jgi:hypothetical protein
MSDEAVKKYNIVSQNFKAQSEGLLKDVVGGISQVIDGSRQNYMDLQKGNRRLSKINRDLDSSL